MQLLFKQKFVSLAGKYEIYDSKGNVVYMILGRVSMPKRYEIYDAKGNFLAELKAKVFVILPTFRLYIGDREAGCVKKKFTFLSPKFEVDCNGWRVDGNIWEWNYKIMSADSKTVATVSKQLLNLTDTYAIDVVDPKDALLALMVVLAIDAEKEGK